MTDREKMIEKDKMIEDLKEVLERTTIQSIKYWIEINLVHQKRYNYNRTSYGIKHIFSSDTGIYATNDEFKTAMLEMGYSPKDKKALNHIYCVSESKSKAFHYSDGNVRHEV